MKCQNCGANYSLLHLHCPYCGTTNPRGLFWKNRRDEADAAYADALRDEKSQKLLSLSRFADRLLMISGAAFALIFLCAFLFFGAGSALESLRTKYGSGSEKLQSELQALYESGDYLALSRRLDETGQFGPEHYAWSQISLIAHDYERFSIGRLELSSIDAGKLRTNDYPVESVIRYARDILFLDIPAYPELDEKNRAAYEVYCLDVETYLRAVLGLPEEDIARLKQEDYLYSDEQAAIVERAVQTLVKSKEDAA